ncbi:MAG: flavin reductase [Clostridia bacterium]|nr:flavin reductase [Clostridia bacterium]
MRTFSEINPEEFVVSPFHLIGSQWMLITAQKGDRVNAMTASWGGLGVMWNKNVAFIAIRPSRYTKEFIDWAQTFSLSFFSEKDRDKLNYLGSVSGRDESKIEKSGLTVIHIDETPCFEEADRIFICKKIFAQPYDPASFLDPAIDACYPQKDYHTLYIGEIQKILAVKAP